MGKYTIGIDFGTLSARCVLVNVADGKETAVSVCGYRHGVMDEKLPSGKALPPGGFALQERLCAGRSAIVMSRMPM